MPFPLLPLLLGGGVAAAGQKIQDERARADTKEKFLIQALGKAVASGDPMQLEALRGAAAKYGYEDVINEQMPSVTHQALMSGVIKPMTGAWKPPEGVAKYGGEGALDFPKTSAADLTGFQRVPEIEQTERKTIAASKASAYGARLGAEQAAAETWEAGIERDLAELQRKDPFKWMQIQGFRQLPTAEQARLAMMPMLGQAASAEVQKNVHDYLLKNPAAMQAYVMAQVDPVHYITLPTMIDGVPHHAVYRTTASGKLDLFNKGVPYGAGQNDDLFRPEFVYQRVRELRRAKTEYDGYIKLGVKPPMAQAQSKYDPETHQNVENAVTALKKGWARSYNITEQEIESIYGGGVGTAGAAGPSASPTVGGKRVLRLNPKTGNYE